MVSLLARLRGASSSMTKPDRCLPNHCNAVSPLLHGHQLVSATDVSLGTNVISKVLVSMPLAIYENQCTQEYNQAHTIPEHCIV